MVDPDHNGRAGALQRAAAFGVHVFTALGAGLGLLALLAAVERRWAVMFAWLGLALVVDGIDGTFARWLRVKERVPRWDGDLLDLVVDILTYVFVPAYALIAARLLPEPLAIPLGLLIVVTGVLYFADRQMKSADSYFMGFPAVWNMVAFGLFLLRPPPWICALIVVGLAGLTFVPLPFVHPMRVRRLRVANGVLLVVAAVLAGVAIASDLRPATWVTAALCAIGLYFLVAGLFRRADA